MAIKAVVQGNNSWICIHPKSYIVSSPQRKNEREKEDTLFFLSFPRKDRNRIVKCYPTSLVGDITCDVNVLAVSIRFVGRASSLSGIHRPWNPGPIFLCYKVSCTENIFIKSCVLFVIPF